MPTPTRRSGCKADGDCGNITTPGKEMSAGKRRGRAAARVLRERRAQRKLVMRCRASGCNKLLSRHGGINLQQEVAPQQTARSPRDSSNMRIPSTACRGKLNIQADGGPFVGFSRI